MTSALRFRRPSSMFWSANPSLRSRRRGMSCLAVSGGVSRNSALRRALESATNSAGIRLLWRRRTWQRTMPR